MTAIIPARTFVHVDADGMPVEAMTNSGRPPAPTDQFFVEGDGGTTSAATPAEKNTVLRTNRGGDWSRPGAWHRLLG